MTVPRNAMADLANAAIKAGLLEEIDRVASSASFSRSPRLVLLLNYLRNCFLTEAREKVNEYDIATTLFGRPASFDPTQDAIVRVEIHRLRRKLKEYYAGEGKANQCRLVIPQRSYLPELVSAAEEAAVAVPETAPVSEVIPEPANPVAVPQTERFRPPKWLLPALLALSAVLVMGWILLRPKPASEVAAPGPVTPSPSSSASPAVAATSAISEDAALNEEIRILAGRVEGRYVDPFGHAWQTDQYFHDGSAEHVRNQIFSLGLDANIFSYMREGTNFRYDIPLKPGFYELTLLFAESIYGEGNRLGGGSFSRQFDVLANHSRILEGFDVIADAGQHNTATAQVFHSLIPSRDGMLHIQFRTSRAGSNAFVNGIILRPGLQGKLRPIRILCRPESYQDSKRNMWEQDRYYRGGKSITRPTGPAIEDSDIFTGERYGDFTYAIPVTPGKYTVKLYFNEFWWGPSGPGNPKGPGLRAFDVFANHQPLLQNFDIMREAGSTGYAVRTFRGVTPNRHNKLVLDFVTRINNAMLNAIEIVPE